MKILLNFAISADGKIGTHTGGASKFTSKKDLERLWKIRASADAIMVGRGTLEADNMSLTVPAPVLSGPQPTRIIVSRTGSFNYEHPVFKTEGGEVHLLTTQNPINPKSKAIKTHHMPLSAFLKYCETSLGLKTLLCEGGGELVRSLAELGVISEINLTLAGHTLIGGQNAPGILGKALPHLSKTQLFQLTHFSKNESSELFLTYQKSEV